MKPTIDFLKPTLIQVKTVIGHGSPNKADCQDAHGEPLGKYEGQVTRDQLGWKYKELEMMDHVYETQPGGSRREEEEEG